MSGRIAITCVAAIMLASGGSAAWAAQPARNQAASDTDPPLATASAASAERDVPAAPSRGASKVRIATSNRAPTDRIAAALAANDVRRAIDLGAKASDVVRYAHAHGHYLDQDVGASQVFVAADGSILAIQPLRPLPPLSATSAGGEGAGQRTAPLYQANPFGLPPGTAIVLSPPGTGEPERYFPGGLHFPGP